MDWSKGYSASYHMTRVDPATWRDIERIEITGGSIKRNTDGLMQSADVDCVNYQRGEIWIRIYLDTNQNGAHAHEALFTGLATSPERSYNGRMSTSALNGYSVLKPADDVILPRGWYAPAGMNAAEQVKKLLSVTPAPITVADGSPSLTNAIIAEDGESRLTMATKILTAIGWRLRIAGDGAISIEPAPLAVVAAFDPNYNDVIETQIDVALDWYAAPNVLMCTDEDMTAIARDDSRRSPLSTVNRGREVWAFESNCDRGDNESIAEYASRRLAELQQVELSAEYDRRFMPGVLPGDLVRLSYPEQGLDGIFAVDTQSIELGHAARTSERVTTPAQLTSRQDDTEDTITGLFRLIDDDRNYIVSDDDDYIVGLMTTEG